ncbi:uncharacterized protein RSE6_02077 [Rhynchosporium secalis]|uniref:Protein kinase domain-containing protein n=1 Tax=Rhynchosporium secalis TaxID=38038 RepID=A0A1E1LZD3_RHYSE|nr:uncharacterized protein RSE6_02077 [Rhynchosporium secalis]
MSQCPCAPACTPMDEHMEQSQGLLSNTARPSLCRMLTTPARAPTPVRPGLPRRIRRSISTGGALPCLIPTDSPSRACSPATLRRSSAPPETYPDIPESDLPELPVIGAGQSGNILLLTPVTVLKMPMPDHNVDLENEYEIYSRISVFKHPNMLHFLGILHTGIVLHYHPLGSLRIFIHGTDDAGLGVTDEHIDKLAQHKMKWAQQIADGVQFLHQNGIVHCDTSSANTLITSTYDVVLCDFSSSIMDGVTKKSKTRCTRWFKFIENDDDDGYGIGFQFTIQDDMWAIGNVYYEMWARKQLWGTFSDAEQVWLYKQKKWPCLEGLGHIENVIAKCWADQYGCAGELLTDLSEVADSGYSQENGSTPCVGEKKCIAWDAVD